MGKEDVKSYKTSSGAVRWRVNSYWGVNPDTGKEVVARKQGFKLKRDAIKWRDAELARLDNTYGSSGFRQITFTRLLDEWFNEYKQSGLRPSTITNTRNIINLYIKPVAGSKYVHRLTTRDIQQCVNSMAISRKDYRLAGNISGRALKLAIQEGIISTNPVDNVEYTGLRRNVNHNNRDDNFYTSAQMKSVLELMKSHLQQHEWVFFSILYYMGLRKGECLALTIPDVDRINNTLTVNKSITVDNNKAVLSLTTKTSSKVQTLTELPIPKPLRPILYSYLDSIDHNTDFIFESSHDEQGRHYAPTAPNKWLSVFYTICQSELADAGITHKITVHGFRHSCASALFSAGADIKDVQTYLRHSNIQTTMNIYTHITGKQLSINLDGLFD